MTCKTAVPETDTAIIIWNSSVGYGNVMPTRQLTMFLNVLPPNSRQLGKATRLLPLPR